MSTPDPAPSANLLKWIDSAFVDGSPLTEYLTNAKKEYDQKANDFWSNLTSEQQLMAFYSVCKRITKGELEDQGTYRYVLYEVFGFGLEAYSVGIDCGYMNLHNSIQPPKTNKGKDASDSSERDIP